MATTLLAHLTDKLTSQRENAATEAIAFVLNRSEAARKALARHLAPSAGEVSPILRVETQHVAGDESRPDIVLLGEGAKAPRVHRGEVLGGATVAQPVDYLRRLGEAGGGVLVMLAPERRLTTLRIALDLSEEPSDPSPVRARVTVVLIRRDEVFALRGFGGFGGGGSGGDGARRVEPQESARAEPS